MTTRPQEEHTIARVRRRRASLLALMLIVGLGLASWVVRSHDIVETLRPG